MMSATYSPDDNKLRLYASARLDADTYARVKAAGFAWAPKQGFFVAPAWTPGREDLLIDLCGEIEDEDKTLAERQEERAERFDGYREKRAADADAAQKAVAAIADNIPFGQPILVGHHSERHARRDAERIENGMRKAVRMWDTSLYWADRAKGALRHAAHKERPDVRARRIKGLEADERKRKKNADTARAGIKLWAKLDAPHKDGRPCDDELRKARALALANVGHYYLPDGDPRGWSVWSALDAGKMTPKEAQRIALKSDATQLAHSLRWLAHLCNRLTYERAMLADGGGIAADSFALAIGGRVLVRGQWCVIRRLNRKAGAVVSVSTFGDCVVSRGLEEIEDYRAPEAGDAEKVKAVTDRGPLCNYPGAGFLHLTKAEYEATVPKWSDFPKVVSVKPTETAGRHRVRQTRDKNTPAGSYYRTVAVYLTDVKRTDPPPIKPSPEPLTPPPPRPERRTEQPGRSDAEPEAEQRSLFEGMRDSLRAGVKVVSAPQLFPTPPELARRVVDLAAVQPGQRVLEPSAGTGNILEALAAEAQRIPANLSVVAVEINAALADRLRGRAGLEVRCADFLSCNGDLGAFDRIVMNPPFENASDVKHIKHALTMLNPGGRLVAICANGPRQQGQLQPLASEWIELEAGTFSGTGVRTALVVIDKEEA